MQSHIKIPGDCKINVDEVPCDLCGSRKYRILYHMPDVRFWVSETEFQVVRCTSCGHRFLNPRPLKSDLPLCYPPGYYKSRGMDVREQNRRYRIQASYLSHMPPGRHLDIGCARGDFSRLMMQEGWDCHGTDILGEASVDWAEGFNYRQGPLDKICYPECWFDAISAWGVFEHLESPKLYFTEVARILNPKGIFVLMVPNAKSLWSRFAFKEDVPRHLHFFDLRSLQRYAKGAGLRIVDVRYDNKIYSRPATGRDAIRINLLRLAGVPWKEMNAPKKPFHYCLSMFGAVIGKMLIHPKIEQKMGISGNMVLRLMKADC